MHKLEQLYSDMMNYISYFSKRYPSIPLEDLEDELNWCFFKTYQAFDESKGTKFVTLFFRVVDNKCKNILRYRDKRFRILSATSLDYNDLDETYDNYHNYLGVDFRNDIQEECKEILKDLKDFLPSLPQGQRTILDLYLKGYSHKEVCQVLQKIPQNISTQKASALKKFLKIHLNEYPILEKFKISKSI